MENSNNWLFLYEKKWYTEEPANPSLWSSHNNNLPTKEDKE